MHILQNKVVTKYWVFVKIIILESGVYLADLYKMVMWLKLLMPFERIGA